METNNRTIFGSYLQACQYTGSGFLVPNYTTLNQRHDIYKDEAVGVLDIPTIGYVGIGNGGHVAKTGANGFSGLDVVRHKADHAGLYNQLPFVLRRPDNDLTSQERSQYRLRGTVTYGETLYVAYWLKRLDLTNTIPTMTRVSVTEEGTVTIPFVPTEKELFNPTKPVLSPGGVNVTTGEYLTVTGQVPFTMDSSDLEEFDNVISIIYDDPSYGIISEIAVCSGIERSLPGVFDGVTMNYDEVIAVQVCNFLNCCFLTSQYNATGINIIMDIGATESLLLTSQLQS